MKLSVIFLAFTFCVSSVLAEQKYSYDQYLRAVRLVESGQYGGMGEGAVGDNGKALGPFQIHEDYWKDALDHDPRIGGSYQDCKKYNYSLKIVKAYNDRYSRLEVQKGKWEVVARRHNGGPDGEMKASTLSYWQRVKAKL